MTNDNYYERSMIGIFHTCRNDVRILITRNLPFSAARLPSSNSCTGQCVAVEAANEGGTVASFPTIA